jgi:hypothetical protein
MPRVTVEPTVLLCPGSGGATRVVGMKASYNLELNSVAQPRMPRSRGPARLMGQHAPSPRDPPRVESHRRGRWLHTAILATAGGRFRTSSPITRDPAG